MNGPESRVSRELHHRALEVLPGGNTRTTTFYPPFPVFIAKGEGCRLIDVDGNSYVDLLNNYTSLIHGHAHPQITERIQRAAADGTVFASPIKSQMDLAERIAARFPSIDLVRFTNSGSEAVMSAVRAARAFTGRDLIVQARGSYHGSWEQISSLGSGVEAGLQGIPGPVQSLIRPVAFNEVADLEAVMSADGDKVAAVLLEPVLGQTIDEGTHQFLGAAQDLARRHGALFVLDEVITARLSAGGRQAQLGLEPDLTTLGKIIGGGLPIGAFGGRRDIMEMFDPRGETPLAHHGTFNGNSLSMEAGIASLELLPASEIERIDELGRLLQDGIQSTARSLGFPAEVRRVGSILTLETPLLRAVHREALNHGVFIAPRGQMSISTPMDETVIDEATKAFSGAFRSVLN